MQRSSQASVRRTPLRASAWSAGNGVHSSNAITMSAPSACWIWIERSGVRSISLPSTSFLKRTPRSVISLRGSEKTWKPPLSVRIGPFQRMKACSPPSFSTSASPGRSARW